MKKNLFIFCTVISSLSAFASEEPKSKKELFLEKYKVLFKESAPTDIWTNEEEKCWTCTSNCKGVLNCSRIGGC